MVGLLRNACERVSKQLEFFLTASATLGFPGENVLHGVG